MPSNSIKSSTTETSPSANQSDAEALLKLLKHPDKEVRKAARKALHKLRSRGIKIAENQEDHRSWSQTSLENLRGPLHAFAILDTSTVPGLSTFLVSLPEEDGYCQLWIVSLTSGDQILQFRQQFQTDGQRHRLLRQWQEKSSSGTRQVPLSWVFERILWARRKMKASSEVVPAGVEKSLIHMSDVVEPTQRPANLLHEQLSEEHKLNPASLATMEDKAIMDLLSGAGLSQWPALFSVHRYEVQMQKLAETKAPELKNQLGTESQTSEDAEQNSEREQTIEKVKAINEEMLGYLQSSEEAKQILQEPVANILDDVAIELWMNGRRDQDVALLLAIVEQLRSADEPASFAWLQPFFQQQQFAIIQEMFRRNRL